MGEKGVIGFFEEISSIPRGSGNEQQISDYLVSFAKQRGLVFHQDNAWNVIIKKPATNGGKVARPVILQSHIDMVNEKNKGVDHDFEKDGLTLIVEDGILRADGTTLGADNGIGVSMCLALLDSSHIEHPALEAVFTTSEEIGMEGAVALDATRLDGRILINIDSEEEGVFTCGCAGGMRAEIHLPIERETLDESYSSFSLLIKGLKGGHSGIEINKERANANILLGRTLRKIGETYSVKLSSVWGGAKDNAIPREAEAVLSVKSEHVADVKECIKQLEDMLNVEYKNTEQHIQLLCGECERPDTCFADVTLNGLLAVTLLIPNGIQHMSTDIKTLPETSSNLGVIKMSDTEVIFVSAIRSSVTTRKYMVLDKIRMIGEMIGGTVITKGEYPAWAYKQDSVLRDLFKQVYKEKFEAEPIIDIIHAGLECGVFAEKIEGIDMISFGPTIQDIHTPMERVALDSVERAWEMLKIILEKLR